MGRELKKVPLDFNYPIGKLWAGYLFSFCNESIIGCDACRSFALAKGIKCEKGDCPDFKEHYKLDLEPPTGEGFQLWNTTTEGHPMSPVFESLELLCEYLEKGKVSVFGYNSTTKEHWFEMLSNDLVFHKDGGAIFL